MRKFLLAALLTPAMLTWAQTPKDVDWPTYGADLANSKYRPLDQINAANFSKLEVAWRFKTDNIGNRAEFKLEGTPLEVGGVVYATAGSRRAVVALDVTPGYQLICLDAKTGQRVASFGDNGAVDLKATDDQKVLPDLTTGEIGWQA